MPAYLVAVCSYPDRAAAESVRDLIDRDAADNAIDGAPSRIVATSVHDTPPVILAGLVRGGEYAHFGEWTRSKTTESEALCVSATGRIVTDNDAALYADYPLTWYRYPEAP